MIKTYIALFVAGFLTAAHVDLLRVLAA